MIAVVALVVALRRRRPMLAGAARRRPVTAFLLLAFTGMWTALTATLLTGVPLRLTSAVGAVLGLAVPAVAMTALLHGRAGVRTLLGRLTRWPTHPGALVLCIIAVPVLTALFALLVARAAGMTDGVPAMPQLVAQFVLDIVVAVLTIQLAEELGWAGFVQETLQHRHGPLRAAVLIAPAFAAIHLPTYLVGAPLTTASVAAACLQLVPVALFAVAFRTLIAWAYNAGGASVLAAAAVHASFNTASSTRFLDAVTAHPAAPLMPLVAVVLLAAVLVTGPQGRLTHPIPGAEPHPAGTPDRRSPDDPSSAQAGQL